MSSIEEPDYQEVFEDLKHLETHGEWRDGVPQWVFNFARQLGVQVGHPAVLYEGWKLVAERAMAELERRDNNQLFEEMEATEVG